MDTTIQFIETVENISMFFQEIPDGVSIENVKTVEITEIVFTEIGIQEIQGIQGKSSYETAVNNGFLGTEIQWLESQKNIDGGLIF